MKPMTPEVRQNMQAILAKAEAGLQALPSYDMRNSAPHDRAVEQLVAELTAAGAKLDARPSWEGSRMSFGGTKSTCTSGTAGVIRNWCAAARKRLEETADV